MSRAARVSGVADPEPAGAAQATQLEYSDLQAALRGVGSERDWFLEGAVDGAQIVALIGAEKTCKSWAMLDLAVACITGGAWLGRFRCRKPGRVILVENEYGQHEIARRLARVCRGRGLEPAAVVGGLLHHYSRELLLDPENDALDRLQEDVEAIEPVLVIIDPWRNHLPGHENDSADTIGALRLAAQLRDAGPRRCVFLPHHLNREGNMSGSRALKSRADMFIEGTDGNEPTYTAKGRTVRRTDAIAERFTIEVEHQDDEDDAIAYTILRARFAGDGGARDAAPVAPERRCAAAGDESVARELLSILEDYQGEALTMSKLRGLYSDRQGGARGSKYNSDTIRRAVDLLVGTRRASKVTIERRTGEPMPGYRAGTDSSPARAKHIRPQRAEDAPFGDPTDVG